MDANSDGTVDSYKADIVSANDYYPFGMLMPGRKYSIANTNYRYGFNGKENDNDIENDAQDYGMRIYDGRLGRFLSVDPLTKKYAELTPYQFASNRTLQGVDLDGKEVFLVTGTGGFFGLFAGGDIGGGIAFGKDGIALVAVENIKLGVGLEIGATINGSFFPTLNGVSNIENSDESGEFDKGFSAAAAWIGEFGGGASKSSGQWGGTVSYGVGVGGHLSFDMGLTIGHKIIKWKDVVKFVSSASQESIQLQKFFGLNDKNINNAQAIIKDFFVEMATSLKNKRISDLNGKNAQNAETIQNANDYLDSYKKSSSVYKFFNYLLKTQTEAVKNNAQKDLEKNNSEKTTLQKTEIKFE